MIEEREHQFGDDVVETEVTDAAATLRRQEEEELLRRRAMMLHRGHGRVGKRARYAGAPFVRASTASPAPPA